MRTGGGGAVGDGETGIAIDATNFPDEAFCTNVSTNFDTNNDNSLSAEEIAAVTNIDVNTTSGITNLTGIAYFTALTSLHCQGLQMTALDVRQNTALTELWCFNNQLSTLNVTSNTSLTSLYCGGNSLTQLDVSKNTLLEVLDCSDMKDAQLTALNVASNTALTELQCRNNGLTELDVSNNTALKKLFCDGNAITALNLASNTALEILWCSNNTLRTLDVSKNTGLKSLYCNSTGISALDLTQNNALTHVDCGSNSLTALDVSGKTALVYLHCAANSITALNISGCSALVDLAFAGNSIATFDLSGFTALKILDCSNSGLTELDVSKNTLLESLFCRENQLTELDLSSNTALTTLNCEKNGLAALDLGSNTALANLVCGTQTVSPLRISTEGDSHVLNFRRYMSSSQTANVSGVQGKDESDAEITPTFADGIAQFTSLPAEVTYSYATGHNSDVMGVTVSGVPDGDGGLYIDAENFPDDYFRAYVRENFDTDNDRRLSDEEIQGVTEIDVQGDYDRETGNVTGNIASLAGIEYFTALTRLDCSYNKITELDVSKNTALTYLNCSFNNLTAIDVSNNEALTGLYLDRNSIATLNLTNADALITLSCEQNKLTELDLSKKTSLKTLRCGDNKLIELDISNNTALTSLECNNNKLTALVISTNDNLEDLDCMDNDIAVLDVSNNTALWSLVCTGNNLTELDVSKNTLLQTLYCGDNKLTALDVSNNGELKTLKCDTNNLTAIDIRGCPKLTLDNLTAGSAQIIHGDMDGLPSFSNHSLLLSGQLGLDFYVSLPEGTDTENARTDFTVNGQDIDSVEFSEATKTDEDDYRFTCCVNSVQMADTITAMFCYSNGTKNMAAAQDYTVKDYLDGIPEAFPNEPNLIALANAIKDYGHYVQIPLARYNGWTIDVKHAEMDCADENIDSDIDTVKAKLRNYTIDYELGDSGLTKLQYDLELETETTLHLYLKPGSNVNTVTALITDDDNEFEDKGNMAVYDSVNDEYVITISGISAHELGKVYTVSVTTNVGACTINASALSYADTVMQTSSDDDLKRAVIALYKYYIATMKYRDPDFTD